MSSCLQGEKPQSSRLLTQSVATSSKTMTCIGQDMHCMNPKFLRILAERDRDGLLEMAAAQVRAGASGLDVNPGPSQRAADWMAWAMPLLAQRFDTHLFVYAGVLAQPELVARFPGRITINAVTAESGALERAMRIAAECHAGLVVLLVRPDHQVMDLESRLMIALEVLDLADRTGLPSERLYLDPLFTWPEGQAQRLRRGMPDVDLLLETLGRLQELRPGSVQTLVALGTGSQLLPPGRRVPLQELLLPLLHHVGLSAVIMNCRERRLVALVQALNRVSS